MDRQTEENNIIKLRRTRGYIPLFLMLSVVLLALSIYCVIYAYTTKLSGTSTAIFYIAGIIGTLFFAYSAFDNLFQTIQPKNALIIGSDSFADFTIGGVGVGDVSWDNVVSVKNERSKDGRLLIIELADLQSVLDSAPKAAQKAILNADWGDNVIAIRQMDVEERFVKVEELFKMHIEESKKRAERENAKNDNSKTKVITDADVDSLLRSMREEEAKKQQAAEASEPADENQTEAESPANEAEKPYEIDIAESEPVILEEAEDTTEDDDVKIIDSEISEPEQEAIPEETPEIQPVAEEIIPEPSNAKDEEKPSKDEEIDLDALLESIQPKKKSENKSDLDDLLSKFNDELRSGKSTLNDDERDMLTNELNALLADIKKKKNTKK